MKKVIIMIYLSVLISSCNGEERKENKKETKKDVQVGKIEKKRENKESDNNTKITYIEINSITSDISLDIEKDKELNDVKLKFLSKISKADSRISNIKDGVCYMVVNGEKRICGRIKNGKREGEWKFWSSSGVEEPEAELNYRDGKLDGICRVGSVPIYIINYKNGKKDGRYNYFGEDGSEEAGLYEDGERIGEWSGYNNAGGFPVKTIYINGEKVEYDILSEEGNRKINMYKYRNNRLEHIDDHYLGNKCKEVYTNGEFIKSIYYDKNGNIKKEEIR